MALLRSEILNKDLIENVIKKKAGTSRVLLNSLTIGLKNEIKSSLIKDTLTIKGSATVKGENKEYLWVSKLINSEISGELKNNDAIKREVILYSSIIPGIYSIINPSLLSVDKFIWSQQDIPGKEIMLFECNLDFKEIQILDEHELNLSHIIYAAEWLARFHGLTYTLRKQDKNFDEKYPELIHQVIDFDETRRFGIRKSGGIKTKLMKMVMKSLQEEIVKDKVVSNPLMTRQDWLDNLKSAIEVKRLKRNPNRFKTLIHGEPWFGNCKFKYEKDNDGRNHVIDCLFQDFHNIRIGNPGDDLAIFLMTSTNRKFREKYLDIVLGNYLKELKDVIASQGLDENCYDLETLKEDYKCGLVMGLTYSLFCVPLLTKYNDNRLNDDDQETGDIFDGSLNEKLYDQHTLDALLDALEFLE